MLRSPRAAGLGAPAQPLASGYSHSGSSVRAATGGYGDTAGGYGSSQRARQDAPPLSSALHVSSLGGGDAAGYRPLVDDRAAAPRAAPSGVGAAPSASSAYASRQAAPPAAPPRVLSGSGSLASGSVLQPRGAAAADAAPSVSAGVGYPPRVLQRAPPAVLAAAQPLAPLRAAPQPPLRAVPQPPPQQRAAPVAAVPPAPPPRVAPQQPPPSQPAPPPPPGGFSAGGGAASPAAVAAGLPLTAASVLKHHRDALSEFEQSEVLEYPAIWYTGAGSAKIRGVPGAPGPSNHGYDDERGDYVSVPHDHLAYRYEVLSLLGKGSFGAVLRCFDHKTQTLRAVKIIRNKKRFHHQALVEVKILEHLRSRDPGDGSNMVHMHEYFYFRSHLCIAFELLSINLYEFIKNNNFQGLSIGLIRRFAQQLLVSLRFLRASRVIHCDLKPENILLRAPNKSGIKVIDFGSSCFEEERVYTYIQSRFYRSPEVILGLPYDVGIDMWSLGCILAELYTGYPLFPGENETEQLACIMEALGVPPRSLLEPAARRKQFFDSTGAPRLVPNSRGKRRRPGSKELALALRCPDAGFVAFLQGCLRWDPRERLSPDTALAHDWICDGALPPPPPAPPPRERESSSAGSARGAQGGAAAYAPQQPAPQRAPQPAPAYAPRQPPAVTASAAAALPSLAIYGAPQRQPPAHLGLASGAQQYAPPPGAAASAAYAQHSSGALTERGHRAAAPPASSGGGVMAALADVRALFPPLAPLQNARTRRC